MTFVVTEPCIQCTYTDCVDVCPMQCFVAGPNFVVIDPDGCIDCSMCVPECPVNAIVAEHDVPVGQREFIALNRELARQAGWQPLQRSRAPHAEADRWAGVAAKRERLQRDADA